MSGLIVHEWISRHGGSEKVAQTMAEMFPTADVLCLWNDDSRRFSGSNVRESWLSSTPLRKSKLLALPFMPATWAAMDIDGYDFVLVSSHLFAHHVGGKQRQSSPRRFVYVHTPARYIWVPELDSRGRSPLVRAIAPIFRGIDAKAAAHGSSFAANSNYVRERVQRCWDRDAVVIYPPVDVERIQSVSDWSDRIAPYEEPVLDGLPDTFILGASRFVPYKRLDLVISAGESAGLPVVLAGDGPELEYLQTFAQSSSVPVTFVLDPSDALLYSLYQRAAVYVFPPVEDFGIMPVEAMSVGTPAIVFAEGGARESVNLIDGGVVIEDFSKTSLDNAISKAVAMDMSGVPDRAEHSFGRVAFKRHIHEWMAEGSEGTVRF